MAQSPLARTLSIVFLFSAAMASLGLVVYDSVANISIPFYILTILYAALTSCSTVAGIQISSGASIKAGGAAANIASEAMNKGIEVGAKLTGTNGNGHSTP